MQYSFIIILALIISTSSVNLMAAGAYEICPVMFTDHDGDKKKANRYKSLVSRANAYKGVRYTHGGNAKKTGFDCSGLIQCLYGEIDVPLPRSSSMQARKGKKVKMNQLRTGDLVFFSSGQKVSHVAMVIRQDKGQTLIVHATSSRGVIIEDLDKSRYWKQRVTFARRLL